MPFTQAEVRAFALMCTETFSGLRVPTTFATRVDASATPQVYGPLSDVFWERYSDHIVAMQAFIASDQPRVLREDRRVRVPTHLVLWSPTLFDEAIQPQTPEEGVVPSDSTETSGAPFVTVSGMPVFFTDIGDATGIPLRTSKGTPVYWSIPGDGRTTPAYVGALPGTRWRVISISDGEAMPFYLFQVRRIPPRLS